MRTQTEQQRLEMPAHPLPLLKSDSDVMIFMGAGWSKGKVSSSGLDCCTVRLPHLQRTVRVFDARNIIHDC
jgi:hypothetical protein|tara:strand:+ start:379 stop:591 length:213 start_codon:yes stop_codon:yes gene_type:complete